MQRTSIREIGLLLDAAYPALFVVSHEERRVVCDLQNLLQEKNKQAADINKLKFFTWSLTQGLVEHIPATAYDTAKTTANSGMNTPESVLSHVIKLTENKNSAGGHNVQGLIVLKDFTVFLQNYKIDRMFRDAMHAINDAGIRLTMVVLDAVLDIPIREEKYVAVVDYDLPTKGEIGETMKKLLLSCETFKALTPQQQLDRISVLKSAAAGLTLIEIENAAMKSLVEVDDIDPKLIIQEKKGIIRKSGVLEYFDADTDLKSVGGLGNLKSWLKVRGNAFSDKAVAFGLPPPRAVLIVGVPGVGKSLTAKCIGREWNMPVLRMDMGALFGSLLGQSEGNLRKAIKVAEAVAPCILFIDELEKGLSSGAGSLDGGTSSRIFGSFLTWMSDKTAPVFVVCTANDVSRLPPELLRSGRFDGMFFADLPDLETRKEIIDIQLRKYKKGDVTFDLDSAAEATENFSGAELEGVLVSSMYDSFAAGNEVSSAEFVAVARKTVPLFKTMQDKIESLREWARTRAQPANEVRGASAAAVTAGASARRAILVRRP